MHNYQWKTKQLKKTKFHSALRTKLPVREAIYAPLLEKSINFYIKGQT